MKKDIGINLIHVPYRGGAPMTTDLISGVVPISIDVVTAYLPFFKSDQLIPLAVTSAKRTPPLPEVPSISELSSYRNLVLDNFFGISGPAKVPADMLARITTACNEILAQADIKKSMLDLVITVTPAHQQPLPAMCAARLQHLRQYLEPSMLTEQLRSIGS